MFNRIISRFCNRKYHHLQPDILGGDEPNTAIGISGDGSNDSTPDSRAWINFADGNNVSLQTVTLTRNNSSITNLSSTAGVMWQLSTNRTGWTSAELTFKYTNAELAELPEENLKLFTATAPTGPWTEVSGSSVDVGRNQISGIVSAFGYYALQGTPTPRENVWFLH